MAPSTVTVLYPALKEGERFDVEYYVTKHLELAVGAWKSLGMKDFQVVKFGAAAGGDTLPYSVAAFITFDSPEGVGKAMASPLTKGVFEDTPNFTNTKPLVLLGEAPASWSQ
ncbi:hypothetical protein AK830_g9866 [Neonectria ditissima]|uniref:EthD domain-containing protein n=1 Tax=Neonectria ditissima TaxID=78410 RepID=A0A0N8H5P1_9HYPO|nr:hypothetical protein AK830_g9866 [Neonectria ditissima]